MPEYKTIPVDEETYQMLVELCQAYERKQGAQVKVLVKTEYSKLTAVKLFPKTSPLNRHLENSSSQKTKKSNSQS